MSQLPASERDLLLRARKGDEGAARALWGTLAPRMLRYASLLAGEAEAGDIVQAVFVRALRAPRKQIAGIDDLAAWMLRCVRNEALNTIRSSVRRRVREEAAQSGSLTSLAGAMDAGEGMWGNLDGELSCALAALPSEQREAVWLYHAAALTFDQLALALDVPRSTAASRYRMGLRRLREVLDPPVVAVKEANHV